MHKVMPKLLGCEAVLQTVLGLVVVKVKAIWAPCVQCGLHVLQELLMMCGVLVCVYMPPLHMPLNGIRLPSPQLVYRL